MRNLIFLSIATILFGTACRKTLVMPNEDSKLLFGTWRWVKTVAIGGINNPSTSGYEERITFSAKGKFERYHNSAKTEKLNFSVAQDSTLSGSMANIITFTTSGFLNNNNTNDFAKDSYIFHHDTMVLQEETIDGAAIYYVRN
jgi:hypothetical protein